MRYLYYIYTLLYIEKERKQTGNGSAKGQTNQEEREPGQRLDCLPSCPPRPRSLPSCGDVGQSKRNRKRENQGEGCRRHLRQFLASLLFRLMSTPSTPSPAAHHIARLCRRSGRGKEGHPVRFRAMPSPPHRHHIASEQQPQGIASTFCHPARLVHVLFLSSSLSPPSSGKGRAPIQPGRAIPSSSPRRPSPPCRGAVRIRLLSSSYHLRIRAIAVWRPVVFERRVSPQKIFSTCQIVN